MTSPTGSGDAALVEQTRAALERALDTVREANQSVIDGFNTIVAWVNDHRWILGPLPLYLIANDLDDIRGHVDHVLELGAKVVKGGTPVLSLFSASIDWLPTVVSPTSQISYEISKPADDNLHHWTGAAAAAYKEKQTAQKRAADATADKTADKAAFISQWLFEIGKANVAYAVTLGKILVDIATDLVKVTTNGLTVINVQFAVNDLAGVVKKIAQEGLNQLVELADRFVTTLGNVRDVLETVSQNAAYEQGRWPQSVYG